MEANNTLDEEDPNSMSPNSNLDRKHNDEEMSIDSEQKGHKSQNKTAKSSQKPNHSIKQDYITSIKNTQLIVFQEIQSHHPFQNQVALN